MAKLYVDLRKLIKNDKTLTDDEKNKKLQILSMMRFLIRTPIVVMILKRRKQRI